MKMFKYYITNDVDTDYEKHFPGREECVAWIIENLDYKKYTWEYGQIHKDSIFSIVITTNNMYLFASCWDGNLKQFSIDEQKLIEDLGKLNRDKMYSIISTNNCKFLFTSGTELEKFVVHGGAGHGGLDEPTGMPLEEDSE